MARKPKPVGAERAAGIAALIARLPERRTCIILVHSPVEEGEILSAIDPERHDVAFRTFKYEGDVGVLSEIGLPIYADPKLPKQIGSGALAALNRIKTYQKGY